MLIPIENRIFIVRGEFVMLDRDLATLYGVKTHVLNQAVRRNRERFPEDFTFELPLHEAENLISQIVISSSRSQFVTLNEKTTGSTHGGRRKNVWVFTEQGVAMLSSVLRSPRAVQVNIQIMRSFVRMRQMVMSNDDLRLKLDALEQRYDQQFKIVFDAMRKLIAEDEGAKSEIGFKDL